MDACQFIIIVLHLKIVFYRHVFFVFVFHLNVLLLLLIIILTATLKIWY